MRERSGVRTENANRRLAVPVAALLVAGLALVATPSSAVPASPPTDTGATAGPATAATALPSHGADRTASAAAVDTDVNEIELARVPDGRAPTPPPQDVPVVAELGQRPTAGYSLVGVTWQAGT